MKEYQDFINQLQLIGKDPSRLIFEDDLTNLYNRRFLFNYFQHKVAWNTLEDHPLSLIMMDVDKFKVVNDTYGHHIGDQVLIWVAELIKEAAGEGGLAIRYAGDEFMILLPQADKQTAMQIGEGLHKKIQDKKFQLDDLETPPNVTLSIGLASAPEDALTGNNLIQKADTALYHAKKSGRNLLANVGDIVPEKVYIKTAINQLEKTKNVGRERQLAYVIAALKKFSQQKSQFLVIEGAAGMGKSEFLEIIRHYIARSRIWQVQVSGVSQELFHPYYLAVKIILQILNQRHDSGTEILEGLSKKNTAYLAQVLPHLGLKIKTPQDEDEKTLREGIFNTLAEFIPKILDYRPVILFIDDLHLGDEATLLLLRRLILNGDVPIFVCSTSMETKRSGPDEQMVPLDRFCATYDQELGIRKIGLPALTDIDIANHIQRLFPDVSLPHNFEKDLEEISQGNPLFIGEILRKLVLDDKISLRNQQWAIEPLEEGYLPKSLEEIVSQKIAALDAESRQLLDHFSIIGEHVSLSVLIGSSKKMESKVHEFVDQAMIQGLINKDFQLNDETIHFLSKRILEFTYQSIESDRKQEMHEIIGNYQESLYKEHILPSAATLAYHFKRSANQESASKYEQLQAAWNHKTFNAREAVNYTGKWVDESSDAETPLDSGTKPQVPVFIRHLLTAIRNIRLYPPESEPIIKALEQFKETTDQILEGNEFLNLAQSKEAFTVNGHEMDATEFRFVSNAFIKFLNHFNLRSITFSKGVTGNELGVLLRAFGRTETKMIDQNFWQRFSGENYLPNISLEQVRYTMVGDSERATSDGESIDRVDSEASAKSSIQLLTGDQALGQNELAQIPGIVRSLIRAARAVRLYPQKSQAISESVELFMEAIKRVLSRLPILALARVDGSLLVNGARVDTSEFKLLAANFLKFLRVMKVSSITFLQNVTIDQVETFLTTLGKTAPSNLDSDFWKGYAKEKGLSGILLNQHLYDILEEIRAAALDAPKKEARLVKELTSEQEEPLSKEKFETILETAAVRLGDLLLKEDERGLQETIKRLFQGFHGHDLGIRKRIIDVCRNSLENLTMAFQCHLAKLLIDPLLNALSREEDFVILEDIAVLLKYMALNLMQFSEHLPASRILFNLQRHRKNLVENKSSRAQILERILNIKLDQNTQKFLMDDLRSIDYSKHRDVAQLLSSLGPASVPLLIDIIRLDDNFRVRKVAVGLLEKFGHDAAKNLKQQLVLDPNAKRRLRIIEVIDSLTDDLLDELPYLLRDENIQVRSAAYMLAERLNNSQVVSLLLDYAKNKDIALATAALGTLGRLKPPNAANELNAILNSTKEDQHRIACCRALGQIADPASIEPLAKILAGSGWFSRLRKHNAQLRATAAFTLGQISHPRVVKVLAPLVKDPDPRVRQIAQTVVKNSGISQPDKEATETTKAENETHG